MGKVRHEPITDRFTKYSDEDRRADALWDKYKELEPWETHGGALLHEQPPHLQRLVYDFSRLLSLNSRGLMVKDVGELPRARR